VFNLFRSYDGASRRRVLNNIFVGIDNAGAVDRPLAYLPAITDDAESDGNCYWGVDREPRIRLIVREADGIRFGGVGETAAGGDPDLLTSDYFLESRPPVRPPGHEANGTTANPRLRRFWGPVHFPVVEDLRLAEGSSARNRGVELTDPVLRDIDGNPPTGNARTAAAIPSAHPRWRWESMACAPSPDGIIHIDMPHHGKPHRRWPCRSWPCYPRQQEPPAPALDGGRPDPAGDRRFAPAYSSGGPATGRQPHRSVDPAQVLEQLAEPDQACGSG
jgi:hypothetical protein